MGRWLPVVAMLAIGLAFFAFLGPGFGIASIVVFMAWYSISHTVRETRDSVRKAKARLGEPDVE